MREYKLILGYVGLNGWLHTKNFLNCWDTLKLNYYNVVRENKREKFEKIKIRQSAAKQHKRRNKDNGMEAT